jgi:hypothetical protein
MCVNICIYLYTMQCYSVIKKNAIVHSFVENWMELEIIILREIRQTQKDKYCMFSLIYRIYI